MNRELFMEEGYVKTLYPKKNTLALFEEWKSSDQSQFKRNREESIRLRVL